MAGRGGRRRLLLTTTNNNLFDFFSLLLRQQCKRASVVPSCESVRHFSTDDRRYAYVMARPLIRPLHACCSCGGGQQHAGRRAAVAAVVLLGLAPARAARSPSAARSSSSRATPAARGPRRSDDARVVRSRHRSSAAPGWVPPPRHCRHYHVASATLKQQVPPVLFFSCSAILPCPRGSCTVALIRSPRLELRVARRRHGPRRRLAGTRQHALRPPRPRRRRCTGCQAPDSAQAFPLLPDNQPR